MGKLLSSDKIQNYTDFWPGQKSQFSDLYQPCPIRKMSQQIELQDHKKFLGKLLWETL